MILHVRAVRPLDVGDVGLLVTVIQYNTWKDIKIVDIDYTVEVTLCQGVCKLNFMNLFFPFG